MATTSAISSIYWNTCAGAQTCIHSRMCSFPVEIHAYKNLLSELLNIDRYGTLMYAVRSQGPSFK